MLKIFRNRTENPRVGGSIPPLGTKNFKGLQKISVSLFYCGRPMVDLSRKFLPQFAFKFILSPSSFSL